jgi:hypothetical protein
MKPVSKASAIGGSLRRALPIFLSERQLSQDGAGISDASFEVQVLLLADEYETLIGGNQGSNMAPSQAGQEVLRRSGNRYDSLIMDAFAKAFGGGAAGAGA